MKRKATIGSRERFSIASSVSVQTIYRIETGKPVKIGSLKLVRDALKLSATDDELLSFALGGGSGEPIDENIDQYSEDDSDIPRFDLSVAASRWVDVTECDQDTGFRPTPAQLRKKLFEVRVRGDSMDGGFFPIPDGTIARFQLIVDQAGRADCSQIKPKFGYYVQLTDGRATFKAAVDCADGTLTLKATNPKYKKLLTAPTEEIARLGLLIGTVSDAQTLTK